MASSLVLTEVLVADLPTTAPTGKQIMFLDEADGIPKVRNDQGVDQSLVAGDLNINNFFLIQSASDWNAHTTDLGGGERQLLAGASYQIVGAISRNFTIVTNGINTVIGINPGVDIDIYTGAGTAWRDSAASNGLTLDGCSSFGVQGSGSRFISQTNSAAILNIDTSIILYDDIGVTDALIVTATRSAFGSSASPVISGMVITSTNTPTISFLDCAMRLSDIAVLTAIDITAATSISSITIGVTFRGGSATGSIGIKGLPNSANLLADARGLISNCNFRTVDTPLDGITVDDLKWIIKDNGGIENTMPDGYSTSIANALVTTINTQSLSEKINAVFTDRGSSQFTINANGRITYIGIDSIKVPIDAGCSVEPVSGTNKVLFIEIAVNGVRLVDGGDPNEKFTKSSARVDNADPRYLSTFTQINMSTNDYVEVFTGNDSDTTNIICTNIKLRVN